MPHQQLQAGIHGLWISLLLLPFSIASPRIRRDLSSPKIGYELFQAASDPNSTFGPVTPKPPADVTGQELLWTHVPVSNTTFQDVDIESFHLPSTISSLAAWMKAEDVIARTRTTNSTSQCVGAACSSSEDCKPIYNCLFGALSQTDEQSIVDAYGKCITTNGQAWIPGGNSTWQCLINLSQVDNDSIQRTPCSGSQFMFTQDNWATTLVDENLQIALQGGTDSDGVFWPDPNGSETFSQIVGWQLWGEQGVQCTLANPCRPSLKCEEIGSQLAIQAGTADKVLKSPWAFLATSAIKNINQQLWNQFNELQDAIESLALDTFNIDDFFPKKGQSFGLRDSLSGLSTLLSLVGGFVPVVGPAISAAGTIASGTATFIGNTLAASTDPLVAQKDFADIVLGIYKTLLSGMDDAVTKLFNGESIGGTGGSFNITDMLKGGVWVNPQSLSNVSDINLKVRTEILSRSIDSLWKTFSSNKIWVIFVDLGEQDQVNNPKCMADTTGPGQLKYCADGGVYYAYNFIEHGDEEGGVGYPWGADQIQNKLGISPQVRDPQYSSLPDQILIRLVQWIVEASAKSYRLMKNAGLNPFNFDQIAGTQSYLTEAFT